MRTVEQWLGEDNKIGIDVFKLKYMKGETLQEWLDRVTNKNKTVQQMMLDKRFMLAGRILSNRGKESGKPILNPTKDSLWNLSKDDNIIVLSS